MPLALYGAVKEARAPTLAIVQGEAIGVGCALAAVCDMTLAADDAVFQVPELNHNIAPTLVMWALINRVPYKTAAYLVYSRERITAQRAEFLGVVTKVIPAAQLASEAEALSQSLLSRARDLAAGDQGVPEVRQPHGPGERLGLFGDAQCGGDRRRRRASRTGRSAAWSTRANELSKAAVTDQLRALGVKAGGVLLVHTSFRAVRPVEGGPLGLIAALRDALGPDGTLVMPSMTDDDDAPFDPATSPSAPDLGVVARNVLAAARRCAQQPSVRLCGDRAAGGGDHRRSTAAAAAWRRQVRSGACMTSTARCCCSAAAMARTRPCTWRKSSPACPIACRGTAPCSRMDARSAIDYGENDHCCERFALADDWLRSSGLQREGQRRPRPCAARRGRRTSSASPSNI